MSNEEFKGPEHGPAWAEYRSKVTAKERTESERLEQEGHQRRVDLRSLHEQTAAAVRAALTPEMRALIWDKLVKDCCHTSPSAQAAVDKALAGFGFAP